MGHFIFIKKTCLSFPETSEETHFEKTSFRVRKKIIATFDVKKNQACLKLSEVDQDVFSSMGKGAIYPVPNKWGKNGWTFFDIENLNEDLLKDALKMAYREVAPKKLSEKI